MSTLQKFKYEIVGPPVRPKLVFLHGLMGSLSNWRKIVNAFKGDFQVLTYDQRGHGRSFQPSQGYAPEDYAEDLKAILDELEWERIHLVGHSMGGRNALAFAHIYAERINKLIIEDIGPEGSASAMESTRKLIEMVPVPFESKSQAKDYFEGEFLEEIKNHPQKGILGPYFYTNIETKPDGTADWRFHKKGVLESLSSGHSKARWEQIKRLNIPTLFVRGELSREFSQEEFEKILSLNKAIKGVEVKGSGHWVHFDAPEEFIRILRDFIG